MIKAYLWFIITLYVLSALGRFFLFFYTDKVSYIDLFESLIGLIACVGLYGYLQSKYFLNYQFWFALIFVGVSLGLYNSFFSAKFIEVTQKIGLKNAVLVTLATYILTAPSLYFLYLYAKSEHFSV